MMTKSKLSELVHLGLGVLVAAFAASLGIYLGIVAASRIAKATSTEAPVIRKAEPEYRGKQL